MDEFCSLLETGFLSGTLDEWQLLGNFSCDSAIALPAAARGLLIDLPAKVAAALLYPAVALVAFLWEALEKALGWSMSGRECGTTVCEAGKVRSLRGD